MMRVLAVLVLLAACGPKHSDPPPDDDLSELDGPLEKPAVCANNDPQRWRDTLDPSASGEAGTELARRQEAACDAVMPRLTSCAVEDACTNLEPAKLHELDLEKTAPVHLRENLKTCQESTMSSRQVRVYEVCFAEEAECGPLAACLENAKPE